jgi:hypothetical protein
MLGFVYGFLAATWWWYQTMHKKVKEIDKFYDQAEGYMKEMCHLYGLAAKSKAEESAEKLINEVLKKGKK